MNFLQKIFTKREPQQYVEEADLQMFNMNKDIDMLKHWIMHLNSKGEKMHGRHSDSIEMTKKDLQNLSQWINHLKKDTDRLNSFMKESGKYILEMHKSQKNIHDRMDKLEKKLKDAKETKNLEKRTTEDTQRTQGHKKDGQKDQKGQDKQGQITTRTEKIGHIRTQEIQVKNQETLTTAQKELLQLLYEASIPLDYQTIAKYLGKKEKSIRNLIYEIRTKGVQIKDKHVGFKKKGFYIEQEEKIRISGR